MLRCVEALARKQMLAVSTKAKLHAEASNRPEIAAKKSLVANLCQEMSDLRHADHGAEARLYHFESRI